MKKKQYDPKKDRKIYFLQIGDYQFATGRIRESEKENEVSFVRHQLKLGESMYLPVFWGTIRQKEFTWAEETYSEEEIQEKLSMNFHLFCEDLVGKRWFKLRKIVLKYT